MPAKDSPAILPEPPAELKQLSDELAARIQSRIAEHGPIPFPEFMESALYEPGLGYYSAGLRKFGEGGDFITAPELGHVFARCLARQIAQVSESLDFWQLMEIGAGTGALCVDLLTELKATGLPDRYLILERSADLRAVQQETIFKAHPELAGRLHWLDQPPDEAWNGVVIANEVIDALPVEKFRLKQGEPEQTLVGWGPDGFEWRYQTAPEPLRAQLAGVLGENRQQFPEYYRSEILPMLEPWLSGLTQGLASGVVLFIDYGYPRCDYYSPARHEGTLVCHYRHRATHNPFPYPGLQDISAFVDFTALAEAGTACGLDCAGYTSQSMFLLGCGLEQVMFGFEDLPDRERLELSAEVKQLTMPGEMGEKFQVMALSRNCDLDLMGFELQDLRHRL